MARMPEDAYSAPQNAWVPEPVVSLEELIASGRVIVDRQPKPPPEPEDSFKKEAEEFISQWFKASWEYVQRKQNSWHRLKNLFLNNLPLDCWQWTYQEMEAHLKKNWGKTQDKNDPTNWRSQLTQSTAQIVYHWVFTAFQSIFSASDHWFEIEPSEATMTEDDSVEDARFNTSEKLWAFLDKKLRVTQVKRSFFTALLYLAIFGTAYSKVIWERIERPRWYQETYIDAETKQIIGIQEKEEVVEVRSAPKVQIVEPDQILPDPRATDTDVQSWSGIGHRVEISRSQVLANFESGLYNINRKEFLKKWPEDGTQSTTDSNNGIMEDTDSTDLTEGGLGTKFLAWEFHGEVPRKTKTAQECVAVWLTETGSDDPESGLLVRLQRGTALVCGKRPFACGQYTPWTSPFGVGSFETDLHLIYITSNLINMLVDNLRLVVQGQWKVQVGSQTYRDMQTKNKAPESYPGKTWPVSNPNEVEPVDMPKLDFAALLNGIGMLKQDIRFQTGVDEPQVSIGGRRKTAAEVHQLEASASGPALSRLELAVETLFNPTMELALASLQQFTLDDSIIRIKDDKGIPRPMRITADEIRTGTYEVRLLVNRQDQTRLARAQTAERILGLFSKLKPIFQMEQTNAQLTPLAKELLKLLDIRRVDEILQPMPPQPPGPGPMGPPGVSPPGAPGPGGPPGPAPMPTPFGPMGDMPHNDNVLAMLNQMQSADLEGRTGQQP